MLMTHLVPMSRHERAAKQSEMEQLLVVAERFRRARDWDATMVTLDKILQSEPGRRGMIATSDLAELWNRKGLCAFALGDYQTAADCFNSGLRALSGPGGGGSGGSAQRGGLLCHRGMAMAELGNLQQAERDLAKAVSYGHRLARRRRNNS
eukprot:SAG22_NODE_4697_length_1189_cov_1.153211_1_plen_150_part_01